MAAYAPIPCQPPAQSQALCMDWSNDAGSPLLAVSGRNADVQVFNDEGERLDPGIDVNRSGSARLIRWHPKNKVLAMGWEDGAISVWSDSAMPQEDTMVHSSPIVLLVWSPEGSRLLTADANGMFGVWKVDKRCRLTPICQYAKAGAITSLSFRNPEARPNSCPDFFFGGESGQVYFANDSGRCTDAFNVGGDIASILYYNQTESVVVVTRALHLVQVQLLSGPVAEFKQIMRVKMSGSAKDAMSLQCIWAGQGTLATVCNESMVRMWDLRRDETYMLSLNDEGIIKRTSSDRITKVSYHDGRGMLAAGTKDGLVVFWRFIGAPSAPAGEEVEAASAWVPVTTTELTAGVQHLVWGPRPALLAAGFATGATVLLETAFYRKVREGVGCIQCGPDKLSISPAQHSISIVDGESETGALVSTGVRIAGADHTSHHVVVWSGKKAEVYEITSQQSCRYVCAFAKDTALIAIKGQTLFCLCGARVEVCNLQGTVKSTLAFTDAEGAPTTFDVMGSFLVVATAHGFIKMWDISRREPRQHGAGKLFVGNDAPADAAQCPLGAIEAVRVNANGSRVAVLATKSNSGSSTPDSKLHVWFVDLDKIENFDFAPVGRRPVSTFWDPVEPRLLACDTVSLHKGGQNSGEARNVMTLFVTPEPSVILQDTVVPEKGHQAFMGIQVPSLFFAYKHPDGDSWQASDKVDGATLQPWTLRDFSGTLAAGMAAKAMQDSDTIQALLNFSYELTIGNMDAAYQAVRLIKSSNVWENMAHVCVKTKRIDVATVCLGNMGLALGAQALRESAKEPEVDARVAIVAIQLGLHEEAEQLYRGCGRYDLLNTLLQACDRWQEALDVATQHDRIHLRSTHFSYAKHLESMQEYLKAIQHYEASDTHRFEVPRMLFDAQKIPDLEIYVNQKQDKTLFKWWAQYCESNGSYVKAVQFYERAQDYLSLVRCHCYKGDLAAAQSIVQTTQNPAAAYHVARQLEDSGQTAQAIEYFSLAGQFNHAVRLAKQQGMDSVLMALALQSSARAMVDVAQYYEQRALASPGVSAEQLHRVPEAVKIFIRNAILLYHKAGKVPQALDLCFRSQLHESLRNIADDLSADTEPELLVHVASFFMQHGQYQKAAQLQITAGRVREALQLCMEHSIDISDEMAEKMTLPKSKDEAHNAIRIECLLKLALCCESRSNYQLAAKKYTQAGDKLKAMQALLKSGDTEKIVFFANVARQAKIYILAANYLQSLDWHNDNGGIMKNIIGFYTKAKAFESLSGFYESCSQVEIDEYRDYEKALSALREALKYMVKARSQHKDERCRQLQQKIYLVDRFVEARKVVKDDPNEMVKIAHQLVEQPDVEAAVRVGDVFALLIEFYHSQGNMQQAYVLIEKMRERKIILNPYLDSQLIEQVYTAMGESHLDATSSLPRTGGGEVDEDIEEDM